METESKAKNKRMVAIVLSTLLFALLLGGGLYWFLVYKPAEKRRQEALSRYEKIDQEGKKRMEELDKNRIDYGKVRAEFGDIIDAQIKKENK